MFFPENRVLRTIFGPEREGVVEASEDCIMRSFITCSFYQTLLDQSN
jgi:hypothetical protein